MYSHILLSPHVFRFLEKKKRSSNHKLLALWDRKGFVQANYWSRWHPFFGMNLVLVLVPCRALSHTPSSLPINQTQHCKLLPGMVSSQAQLCRSNLELMQTVIQAAREVKKTCQKTFADMRWNCSSIDIPVDAGKYRPDLERGMPPNFFLVCTSF